MLGSAGRLPARAFLPIPTHQAPPENPTAGPKSRYYRRLSALDDKTS